MKAFFIIPIAVAALVACDRVVQGPDALNGTMVISFISTRAEVPDTNEFLLSVTDAGGKAYYSGKYGAAPEKLDLAPGSYTVRAVSREFKEPLFESPQYGDEQVVVVESGKVVAVHLACAQMNAGLKLRLGETFLVNYPGGTLYAKSPTGLLMYDYSETRTGYFQPGLVWLELSYGGETTTLFSRELTAQEMLCISIHSGYSVLEEGEVAQKYGEGLTMELDTSRNWTAEEFVIGEGGGGSELSSALSVGQARSMAAEETEDVWVYGYIVGGDCTSTGCSFTPPFTSSTNLLIAAKTSCVDKESCLSVQLKKGDIRDALNLMDHPGNIGRQVYLRGDLVAKYYGIPGIGSLSEYKLD